jgi:hypothetical protein
LEFGGEDPNFLALKVGQMPDRRPRQEASRRSDEECGTVQPSVGAKPEHELEHRRIGGDALAVLDGVDETWGGHHFETLVNADVELRRNDRHLDCAELHAFDLPRHRAQLARRIDLGFDAAARIALNRGGEVLGEHVRRIVDGGKRDLHHDGLALGVSRCQRQHQRQGACGGGSRRVPKFCMFA